jgi:peptidoglycan/LPS O-acetylase OafA/YrhL
MDRFRLNNFDLLRLLAALQVVFGHSIELTNLSMEQSHLFQFIHAIPGVPLFFFISGFLISKSYETQPQIQNYTLNRVLRIFPGLWFCLLISLILIYFSGYQSDAFTFTNFSIWLLGQMSFIHFYHPEFFKGYGIGVLNGSLWTIGIELQFYIITPLLYKFLFKKGNINKKLFILILIFMCLNLWFYQYRSEYHEHLAYKLFGVTFVPYFYMFLVGVFFQKNFELFYKYLAGKGIIIFLVYLIYSYILYSQYNIKLSNGIGPWLFFPLACMVFSLAYTSVSISHKLLKHQDISYGLYIYHMPVVNTFIYLSGDWRFSNEWTTILTIMVLTASLAIFSWFTIEKPALRLKKKAFFSLQN